MEIANKVVSEHKAPDFTRDNNYLSNRQTHWISVLWWFANLERGAEMEFKAATPNAHFVDIVK